MGAESTRGRVASEMPSRTKELEAAAGRIGDRIHALQNFDASTVRGRSAELTALSATIADTIEKAFRHNPTAAKRFGAASTLQPKSIYGGGMLLDIGRLQSSVRDYISQSIKLLVAAKNSLIEDIEDSKHDHRGQARDIPSTQTLSRKIFLVHGHDVEARELVAAFLRKADLEPIILHEQTNEGRTIIEKVEAHSDVGFAVVLLTPDDVGSIKEGDLQPRARQNVLLELGYFMGLLGRKFVCAMRRGDIEIPSDWQGVVNTPFDDHGGWRQALARELDAAGIAIDWRRAMS